MPKLTTLANYQEATINGIAAQVIFANTALENIYQEEIEKGGRGCTQKFSSDTSGAQIRVVRPLPLPVEARKLGAAINGGNFSAYVYQPETQSYGLDIITTIDDQVDIPNVNMDMIPVDIAQMYIKNISDKVVLNMNAIKIAARAYTCLSAEQATQGSASIVRYTAGTDKLLDKVIGTNAELNRGDRANGVSTFPVGDRIGLVSANYYAEFLTSSGVLNLGGANYAYDILRKGGLDKETDTPQLLNDGYIGTIVGIPFHFVSDLVLSTACAYLGFPETELDNVVCHISSAHGNLFGLATGNSIKTIDSPSGQGVRLQPLYRMGAACIMPKSVAWLVDGSTFENPYGAKAIFTNNSIVWGYVAPGSRQHLKATLTAGASATAFTPAVAKVVKAPDGTESETALTTGLFGAWVVGEAFTVQEFLAEYNAANAVKGSITTFGASNTFTGVTSGKTVSILVCDKDGTLVLARAQAA